MSTLKKTRPVNSDDASFFACFPSFGVLLACFATEVSFGILFLGRFESFVRRNL
jgi:hypothetical protein